MTPASEPVSNPPSKPASTTTPEAFFSIACRTKSWPSNRGPFTAKKRSPGLRDRVSMEYPRPTTAPGPDNVPPMDLATSSSGKFIQQLPNHNAVVKIESLISNHLVRFVSLAGHNHRVSRARGSQSETNSFAAIGDRTVSRALRSVWRHTGFDFANDCDRILATRVVRCQDREITQPCRHASHQGTLGAVSLSGTAENDNEPARR